MANTMRSVCAGEILFKEGDPGDSAYLIERGRILVYLNKEEVEIPLRTLGEGDVFGEMSLLDNSPRSASCRALEDGRLFVVSKEQLLDRIKSVDPVVKLLMRALMERLRSQNEVLRGFKSQVEYDVSSRVLAKREALDRIELENRISSSLDEDEFIPYYQPIYDLETGRLRGCEALIRWISADGTIVPQSLFMDILEESSLILKAGKVIIEKTMADLGKILERFGKDSGFFASVNVSGRQFADTDFISHLERTRISHGVNATNMKLELTERIMTEGPEALATLDECRKLGYQLAIDDFGTGFSSLQYLAQMPLTDLKIDQSFVMRMQSDQRTLSIIKSLIYMSDLLGLRLIAEGVETKEEAEMLKGLKVHMAQGFHFSRALPLDDFLSLPKQIL